MLTSGISSLLLLRWKSHKREDYFFIALCGDAVIIVTEVLTCLYVAIFVGIIGCAGCTDLNRGEEYRAAYGISVVATMLMFFATALHMYVYYKLFRLYQKMDRSRVLNVRVTGKGTIRLHSQSASFIA